jgi:hypothetical protein
MMDMKKYLTSKNLILAIGIWLAITSCFIAWIALAFGQPNFRAVILMALGLILFWVLLGGMTMRWLRDSIRIRMQAIRIDWRIQFVLFATLLALIEEWITTTMTNLAPLFGVPVGAAYITASNNYFDVVCLHSVVVFIPMFVCWAFLLQFLDFSPNAVFLLFGITGLTAEIFLSGWQAVTEFGLWIFVYGLMVYLPAYVIPAERGAKPPRWWHYAGAVFLPVLFAMPAAAVVGSMHPTRIHFPPILPGT